ncbi:hypothetical protein GGS21DRAFT_489976 [Xylaria nigripes]|nr:hypothetical protein GGS21DRAFT_489976 [Xylaria nigripes]
MFYQFSNLTETTGPHPSAVAPILGILIGATAGAFVFKATREIGIMILRRRRRRQAPIALPALNLIR